jgi:hypothetical protein
VQLSFPLPPRWLERLDAPGRRYGLARGLELIVSPAEPLPVDVRAWALATLEADVAPPFASRIVACDDSHTEEGWAVAFVTTDVVDTRAEVVVARRIHALFRFHVDAVVAEVRTADVELLDARAAEICATLRRATLVPPEDELRCLEDLWRGLEQPTTVNPVRKAQWI